MRPLTAKPLIVKLTPNAADVARVAQAAEASGADAVSLINTLRAFAPHPRAPARRGWAGARAGCRPGLRAVALAQVRAVAGASSIPIVGMGGSERPSRARPIDAGATLVGVGTESFRDPPAGAQDPRRARRNRRKERVSGR